LVLEPLVAGAAPEPAVAAAVSLPVTGSFTDGAGVGKFIGTFTLDKFDVVDGKLVAIGKLTGTLTNALGAIIGTIVDLVLSLLVTGHQGTCDILHLELGPIDLDLLGLMVHLDKIVLDITAQSGPGNLVGNLLCAVAHLLDGHAGLHAIAALLNAILGALG
jgi:hypothetical protein